MTQPSNAALLEMLRQLREDIAADREARRADDEAARQSRASTHGRIDEVINRLGRINATVALAGQVDAMVRSELDALKTVVSANQAEVAPTVAEWKKIMRISQRLPLILGVSGVSIGAAAATALAWFGDGVAQ